MILEPSLIFIIVTFSERFNVICEKCKKEHDVTYGSGRFCSEKCCRSFSTFSKRKEINQKVSEKLRGKLPNCMLQGHTSPFRAGYDSRRKILTNEDRENAKRAFRDIQRKKTLSKPFESLSKGTRKWILLEERGNKCEMCGIEQWLELP